MTRREMLLTILAEECNETAQRASKAIRFGLEEIQEGQYLTNAQRIVFEFNDLYATIELMWQNNMIPDFIDVEAIAAKKVKIDKWIKYSIECGTINL